MAAEVASACRAGAEWLLDVRVEAGGAVEIELDRVVGALVFEELPHPGARRSLVVG